MIDQTKHLLFKPINIYVSVILLVAGLYGYFVIGDAFSFPEVKVWLIGTLSLLLVWQCGFRFPYMGMISMERLVQFHLLLTLPISETLAIITVASLVMPFINKSYRMGSYQLALIRATNNLAMNTIMLLTAALILDYGQVIPLHVLDGNNIKFIALTAVVMQVINIGMIYIYFSIDRKKVSKLFTPAYLFADFVFVPVGVLSALLMTHPDPLIFILFVFFMVVLLLSFYGFNMQDSAKESTFLYKGTDYHSSYLDLKQATAAINSRCDQLFNCQALYLQAVDSNSHDFLIAHNQTSVGELTNFVSDKFSEDIEVSKDSLILQGRKIDYMMAPFLDHNGVFARVMVVRDNQVEFLHSDLNLLRLFVQRYRPGLSYALTYEKLSEYKNNLELKVAERTEQLEKANLEKSELVDKLKKISSQDALTGLYNRRYFDELMGELNANTPSKLSLAIVDLDHFKQINDQFGHDTGDQVLKSVATLMSSWSASETTLVRYGGEEFVLVFSEVMPTAVADSLETLMNELAVYDWKEVGLSHPLTVSIGLANFPENDIEQLFENADCALYYAKEHGRNQLKLFKSES